MRKVMHAMFGGLTRAVLILVALVVVIAAGPAIAAWLDDRDLPGSAIVFIALLLAAGASGFAFFFTMTPRRARTGALRRLGDELDLPYTRRIDLPRGVSALPSFQLLSGAWTVHDGIEGHRGSGPLLVFARSWSTDGYEPTHWAICAATTTMLAAPKLLIGPRHPSVDERAILDEVGFESEAFNRMWEVRTDDHLLASTIVDERMMAWLLERTANVSFELGGPWAMTVSHGTEPAPPSDLVDALDGFLGHVPRVAISELGRGY